MITLAAGGGDYIFLVVMLVFGLINWLANKVKEGKAPPPEADTTATPPRRDAPPSADPEADRMRRFLEALGVPGDAPETPAAPPISQRARLAPRPLPPPLPPPEYSFHEEDATPEPVEHVPFHELQTRTVPEFETVSSRVSADPHGDFETLVAEISAIPTVDRLADTPLPERLIVTDAGTVRATLRSPANVRTALILREILGPPRSLQS